MGIDVKLIRDPSSVEKIVRDSELKRFKDLKTLNKAIEYDEKWRKLRFELDGLNFNKNRCGRMIASKVKASGSFMEAEVDNAKRYASGDSKLPDDLEMDKLTEELVSKLSIPQIKVLSVSLDGMIAKVSKELCETQMMRDQFLNEIGNVIHSSVVVSNDEDCNGIERIVGDCCSTKKYSHVDLLPMIGGVDYKRGVSVAGGRGYFLKGPGVFLAQALIQYSLSTLYGKGYTALYTPFFMNKDVMHEVAQLSQFDEELYKVVTKHGEPEGNDSNEKYLIATSEQPIAAFHRGEWMDPDSLPIMYAGISSCFRQEVGSHGRDTAGIFRVHQFEKIEQFTICSPRGDESWKMFDKMINVAEEFYQSLGIGYRIVNIVSGALNNAAAKKYDLEAWFPGSQAFRELVSCSNCTDYQSRRLLIRYGMTKSQNQDVEYVHMLNATMCAVTRVLCCLLETHQTEAGIHVPEKLHSFLPPDMKFIKYVSQPGDGAHKG